MNTHNKYDIAVVYSEDIAQSAQNFDIANSENPFAHDFTRSHYERSYSHLLKSCIAQGLTAIFTTSRDIIGPGSFSSGWLHENGEWVTVQDAFSTNVIFDKFTPKNYRQRKQKQLLASNDNIDFFNHLEVSDLFHDKLAFYSTFSHCAIPTAGIEGNTQKAVDEAIERLSNEISRSNRQTDYGDFFVIKDRYGAGGNNIYQVNKNNTENILSLIHKNPYTQFVIQPFIMFDKGLTLNNRSGYMDVRILLLKEKIVQAYIRVAEDGEFRCNEHQGADLEYINIADIPDDILSAVQTIATNIPGKKPLYALDFIRSNNGNVYLMEGNHSPGLDFNIKKRKNARKTRELIDIAVSEIARRVEESKIGNCVYIPHTSTGSIVSLA